MSAPYPEPRGSLLAAPQASSFAEGPHLGLLLLRFLWVGPGPLLFFQNGMGHCTCICTFIALVFLFWWPLKEMPRFTKRKAEESLFLQMNILALFFYAMHSENKFWVE